ncbi:MAG: hypothetical protein WCJ33_07710, partial [Pseudomonadota bacterium]
LALGIYLLFIIPIIMALIYYIFEFSLLKKIVITALMLVYFILFLPFQYMLHAVIINAFTLIFLPVLYLNFGLMVDILMFIGWYSFAMSGNQAKE